MRTPNLEVHHYTRTLVVGLGFLLMATGLPSDALMNPPFGSTLVLDGDADFVTVPHAASLSPSPTVTVEAWINASGQQPREAAIAGKWNDLGIAARSYMLFIFQDQIEFLISHNTGNFPRATSTTPVAPGTWQHVAGTFDGSTIRIYIILLKREKGMRGKESRG